MEKVNHKLGFRELISIIILIIAIKSEDMTTLNVFPSGKTATWMYPIIWYGIMIIPIILLNSILKKYKDKNIIDLIYMFTGKYVGFIISFGLFLILLAATILDSRSYVDILDVMLFVHTPKVVLYILLMGASYFLASRGLDVIGRVSYIIFPILIGFMFILFNLLWKKYVFENIFPLLGDGIGSVFMGGVKSSTCIGEFILFAVFFPFIKDFKSYNRATIIGLGISCLLISVMFIVYIFTFDYVAPGLMTHAYTQLTRQTSVGVAIPNLSAFFASLWLITAIIRFSIYLYGLAILFSYTFKINRFEPLILPFTTLTIIVGLIPLNPVITIIVLRGMLLKYTWFIFIVLPVLLWSIMKMRGMKNENA